MDPRPAFTDADGDIDQRSFESTGCVQCVDAHDAQLRVRHLFRQQCRHARQASQLPHVGHCQRELALAVRRIEVVAPHRLVELAERARQHGRERRRAWSGDHSAPATQRQWVIADSSGARGPGAFRQVIDGLSHAFPDIRYTVEDLVAEDDRVAVRWYWSGTHRAPFRGLAPTERSLTNSGVAIFRLRAGKITAATLETDRLGFLQSIGVVPPNEALFGAGTAKPGAEPASP